MKSFPTLFKGSRTCNKESNKEADQLTELGTLKKKGGELENKKRENIGTEENLAVQALEKG